MIIVCDIKTKREKKMKHPYENNHKYINGVEHKICTRCNNLLPMNVEWFYKNKSSPDSFNSYCKKCTIKKSVQWQNDNYDRYQEWFTERNKKFGNDYYKDIKRKWNSENKDHLFEYKRQWDNTNQDKLKEYRERYGTKKHKISKKEWARCKEYFNYCCAYCGMPEDEHKRQYNQQLHKEHVIPEGRDDIKNCVPSCRTCNSSKHIYTLNSWYNESNPIYDKERYMNIYYWIRYNCKNISKVLK